MDWKALRERRHKADNRQPLLVRADSLEKVHQCKIDRSRVDLSDCDVGRRWS